MKLRKHRPPPDLQALVEAWGGYDKIPPQAWAEFDVAMESWKARVRNDEIEERDVPF